VFSEKQDGSEAAVRVDASSNDPPLVVATPADSSIQVSAGTDAPVPAATTTTNQIPADKSQMAPSNVQATSPLYSLGR